MVFTLYIVKGFVTEDGKARLLDTKANITNIEDIVSAMNVAFDLDFKQINNCIFYEQINLGELIFTKKGILSIIYAFYRHFIDTPVEVLLFEGHKNFFAKEVRNFKIYQKIDMIPVKFKGIK